MTAEADPKAEERLRVILEHLAGRLSATEAATELGVSRKTYYEWLERARAAMREALADRPGGRPSNPVDPEKERLQEAVKALERDRAMLESRLRIQQVFRETLDALTGEPGSKKKSEGIGDVIAIVEQTRQETGESCAAVCREMDLAYSSVRRWLNRSKAGEALIGRPGPAKTEPLNVSELHAEILELPPGPYRTRGTGALYERYRHRISRRDFLALVEAVRRELMQEEQALERRVEWLVPGLVWSMDDTDLELQVMGKGHIHLLQDLGSRYKLRALGDEAIIHGDRVAENLAELFVRRDPPLFLKRDNGSNLNHHAVNEVLDEFWVIPLNSPPHYPPYNGAIERAQQEIQREVQWRIGKEDVGPRVFRLECEVGSHELNHRRRRSLGWKTSCRALEDSRPCVRQFGRRERKEVYEEIKELAVDIAEQLDQHTDTAAETAFRYAAETWMQENGLIRVSQNGVVLPCFHQIFAH